MKEAITELSKRTFDPAEFPFQLLASSGIKDAIIKHLCRGETNEVDCNDAKAERKL